MSKTNRSVAPHYLWGEICEGWRLLDSEGLSVIEELMPPQTKETRHVHARANQLFYVLAGTLTIELDGQIHELTPSDALNVQPGQAHQALASAKCFRLTGRARPGAFGLIPGQSEGELNAIRLVLCEGGMTASSK